MLPSRIWITSLFLAIGACTSPPPPTPTNAQATEATEEALARQCICDCMDGTTNVGRVNFDYDYADPPCSSGNGQKCVVIKNGTTKEGKAASCEPVISNLTAEEAVAE